MANQHKSDVCKLCPEGHIHPILFIYLFIYLFIFVDKVLCNTSRLIYLPLSIATLGLRQESL